MGHTAEAPGVKRRDFIVATSALVGTAFGVDAQPTAGLRRVGWLDYSSSAENLGIFEQAMSARGWAKDRTYAIEYRGGEGKTERLAAVAAELVRLPVDLIVAPGTPEALAAKDATKSIPVVMTGVNDPVERGLVASLARPGGNITGLANAGSELNGKLLSLLREALPRASGVAVIWDSTDPEHSRILPSLRRAARALGLSVDASEVRGYADVEPAFAAIRKRGSQMLIVLSSTMLIPRWIADLALKYELPLASTSPGYVYEGGLMAYTNDWNAVFDRVGNFVDRILRGGKPADLPVELPEKFKLILNARTARSFGLTLPASIMVRADLVIN
jgi:putative ABC transport system substrate-binding protein